MNVTEAPIRMLSGACALECQLVKTLILLSNGLNELEEVWLQTSFLLTIVMFTEGKSWSLTDCFLKST